MAALTAAILLSNVVAITFAGLFSTEAIEMRIKTDVQTAGEIHIRGQFTDPGQEMFYILAESLSESSGVTTPSWTTPEYYIIPFHTAGNDTIHEYEGPSLGIGVDIKCDIVDDDSITEYCNGEDDSTVEECGDPELPLGLTALGVNDTCWSYVWSNRANLSGKVLSIYRVLGKTSDNLIRSANCSDTLFAVWAEQLPDPRPARGGMRYADTTILKCTSEEKVVRLMATVNEEQKVLSTSSIRPLDEMEIAALYQQNVTSRLAPAFLDIVRTGINTEHNRGAHEIRWFDHLMGILDNPIVWNLGNASHLPDTTSIAAVFEDTYRRLFAINLQLYADDILAVEVSQTAPGEALVVRERVYLSSLAFYASMPILLYTAAMLATLY